MINEELNLLGYELRYPSLMKINKLKIPKFSTYSETLLDNLNIVPDIPDVNQELKSEEPKESVLKFENNNFLELSLSKPKPRGVVSGKQVNHTSLKGLLDLFEEEGISVNVTSWLRTNNKSKAGSKSHHVTGNAMDIIPGNGETWDTLRLKIKGNLKLYKYFKNNNIGILDETTKQMLARTGGTGAHWHIGPDQIALKGLDTIFLLKGGEIPTKLLGYGNNNESNLLSYQASNYDYKPLNIPAMTPSKDVFSALYIREPKLKQEESIDSELENIEILSNPKLNTFTSQVTPTYADDAKNRATKITLPKDWEMKVFQYFKDKGLGDVLSAAIVGNLRAESQGDPNVKNFEGSGATGLQQWLGARLKKLKEIYGETPTFDQLLEYLWNESSGKYSGLGWNYMNKGKHNSKSGYYLHGRDEFMNANDIETATIAWNLGFGRPGKHELKNNKRIEYAKNILSQVLKNSQGGIIKFQKGNVFDFSKMKRITINDYKPDIEARLDNTTIVTQPRRNLTQELNDKKLKDEYVRRLIIASQPLLKADTRNSYQKEQDAKRTKLYFDNEKRKDALYANLHLWAMDPTRRITRQNVEQEFNNNKNLLTSTTSAAFLTTGLATSIPKTLASIAGGSAGEKIADKLTDGDPYAKFAGSLIGGSIGWKGMGNLQQYKLFPKANPNSHYRNIGNKEGYIDVLTRGEISPPIKTPKVAEVKPGITLSKTFTKAFYGHKGKFVDPNAYKGKYFVEANNVPMETGYGGNWGYLPTLNKSFIGNLKVLDPNVTFYKRIINPIKGKEILHKQVSKELPTTLNLGFAPEYMLKSMFNRDEVVGNAMKSFIRNYNIRDKASFNNAIKQAESSGKYSNWTINEMKKDISKYFIY